MFIYTIRQMTPDDVNECLAMTTESFGTYDYPSEQFTNIENEFNDAFSEDWWGRPTYFVCLDKDKIVGMCGCVLSWLDWDTFEFFWLSVRKSYQGQGIGKALIKHMENFVSSNNAFKKDITIMFSCTLQLIEYYQKNDYKIVLPKADGKEVIMGKTFLKA